MSDLDRLIAAVEGGTWDGSWRWLLDNIWDIDKCQPFSAAYHGSIDAAMALHKALLPGWRLVELGETPCTSSGWCAILRPRDAAGSARAFDQPSAARALLLAILRAYRQQRGSGE